MGADLGTFAIAPSDRPFDRDLAGDGNTFESFEEALTAAESMDETNPLADGAAWEVFESVLGAWKRVSFSSSDGAEAHARKMIAEVTAIVGADDTGDLGTVVRQAIADGLRHAEEIAEIVRAARIDFAREHERA